MALFSRKDIDFRLYKPEPVGVSLDKSKFICKPVLRPYSRKRFHIVSSELVSCKPPSFPVFIIIRG